MQINTLFTRALACQLGATFLVAAPMASAQTSDNLPTGTQTPEEMVKETVQDLTGGAEAAAGSVQEDAASVLDALEAELDELEAEVTRQEGDALIIDATGAQAGSTNGGTLDRDTTEASSRRALQDGTNAAGEPSNGFFFQEGEGPRSGENTGDSYFFEEDGARAFWRSDGRHIVHPVTAPNYNADAYITSDVRGHYINHQFPTNNVNPEGGAARLYGFQFRKALSDALQIQISKLGFNDVHLGGSEQAGLDDLGLAIKYAFLQDWESQTHASVGLGYEIAIGDEDTLGDDSEIRVFGAFNKGFDRSHMGISVNALFATGSENVNGDSDRLSAHLHYDYEVNETFSPIVELNYYSTLSNGTPVTPFNGLDLGNFGGNEDEDAFSYGVGGEFRLQRDLAVRLAFEGPLTDNVDLWGYRWTASAVWRF